VKTSDLRAKLISGVMMAMFFGIALFLRVYLPYKQIFTANWVKYSGNDAYYQMRIVDNLVRNFPHLSTFDPYLIFPNGQGVGNVHFFNWLLAAVTWGIGLGSPSEHLVDVIGAYYPAVLGALVIIPVYFIGKELLGRWAGLLSAGLVVLLPGEFMGRSILGYTDQHVAEALFTAFAMLFLIMAVKRAAQVQLTFSHLRHPDWQKIAKPVLYSALAGFFLGIYLFTWLGALLFFFLIALYFLAQFIIDHLKHKSTDYLGIVGFVLFLVAFIFTILITQDTLYLAAATITLLLPLVLSVISRLMARKLKPVYYPLALVGLGLAGLGALYLVTPSLVKTMLTQFSFVFFPSGVLLTTIEAQPLLFPGGQFSMAVALGNFTTALFFSLIALVVFIYLSIKQGSPEKTALVVWSLVILAATLGQRRFAYYLAVNIALLTGCLCWLVLSRTAFKESVTRPAREVGSRKAVRSRNRSQATTTRLIMAFSLLIVFFLVFFPNIKPAIDTASQARFAPSDAWSNSLSWLRQNTPEPFGDPDAYYRLEKSNQYPYPSTAYGVLAWWDYGYWITRAARRIPNANPSQDPVAVNTVANFFTSQAEEPANKIANALGSAYVVIDYETAESKFWAIAQWAGRRDTEFMEDYLVQQDKGMVLVRLFYPEYYRSVSTRLYNFDGKAVTPANTYVISYQEKTESMPYRVVTNIQQFTGYQDAEAFVSSNQTGNYRIVGTNPFVSPAPLEAMQHYQLVYSSPETTTAPNVGQVPSVKIFQYTR